MAVGVTTLRPRDLPGPPDSAEDVSPSWLVGFDGATWDGTTWGLCDWHASTLAAGDVVHVAVQDKKLEVSVNGQSVAKLKAPQLSAQAELFALVDLLGCTTGVRLSLPDASQGGAPPPKKAGRRVQKNGA